MNRFARVFFSFFFTPDPITDGVIDFPKKILIIRQHNQLGDLLASSSLFRAIKSKYPLSHITLIVSPANQNAVTKNKFIDRVVIFDKQSLFNPLKLISFFRILREEYSWVLVPVTVSISFTSNLMAGIANGKLKVGAKYLEGKYNDSDFFFNLKINYDWRRHPDMNISERILDTVTPLGIEPAGYSPEVSFDSDDDAVAEKFLGGFEEHKRRIIVGLHVGAGKVPNRWYYQNFVKVIEMLKKRYDACIYLTGSKEDIPIISKIQEELKFTVLTYIDKTIPQVAAVIAKSDLFITNDTGIMHVAGATKTPQISIFGPTNPFVWAPMGPTKFFLHKSDIIDEITIKEVSDLAERIVSQSPRVKRNL
jgi:ADP-heptose:LPS heptosyltransferase